MTTEAAINALSAKVCRCGQPKPRRTAFCGSCYAQLTDELRRGLWRKIGRGFEAAYEAAVKFLEG